MLESISVLFIYKPYTIYLNTNLTDAQVPDMWIPFVLGIPYFHMLYDLGI